MYPWTVDIFQGFTPGSVREGVFSLRYSGLLPGPRPGTDHYPESREDPSTDSSSFFLVLGQWEFDRVGGEGIT